MIQARSHFKTILLLGLVLVSVGGWLSAQEADTNLLLTTTAEQVATGDTLTLNIEIENVNEVYGGRIKLAYDPTLFELILHDNNAVAPGPFFSEQPGMTLRNTADPLAGIVDYALTLRRPAEPVSGSGLVASVEFRALAAGTANFELLESVLSSPNFEEIEGQRIATSVDNIAVNVQGLSLEISGEAVAPIAPPVVEEVPVVVAAESSAAPIVDAPAEVQTSLFDRPAAPMTTQRAPSAAVVAGIAFFILGLLMFMFGLLSFVRLRQNYRLVY